MAAQKSTVAEERRYLVKKVAQAKEITRGWLCEISLQNVIDLGLPEVDDRYHIWRVPLLDNRNAVKIGEAVIDAYTTAILFEKTTRQELLEARLLQKAKNAGTKSKRTAPKYFLSSLRNTVGQGDCVDLLDDMPSASVDLIFTSPPYFNARPEYSEYEQYEQYLFKMRQVIKRAHRVLNEGRFFVMNTAPVLLRRSSRSEASKRLAVPFDLHRIFVEEGFEFIDDIIWVKPEGAGWATSRGRRFAADRNPLQYKAVPVTEYVLVYRKKSDQLIDWHIRNHPLRSVIAESKIGDDYERTNVWRIHPASNPKHPAVFPIELAEKVVRYYSFKSDVVLDPFAGTGTVGAAAAHLGRRFVLFEMNPDYISLIQNAVPQWLGRGADDVLWLGCPPPTPHLFTPASISEKDNATRQSESV